MTKLFLGIDKGELVSFIQAKDTDEAIDRVEEVGGDQVLEITRATAEHLAIHFNLLGE